MVLLPPQCGISAGMGERACLQRKLPKPQSTFQRHRRRHKVRSKVENGFARWRVHGFGKAGIVVGKAAHGLSRSTGNLKEFRPSAPKTMPVSSRSSNTRSRAKGNRQAEACPTSCAIRRARCCAAGRGRSAHRVGFGFPALVLGIGPVRHRASHLRRAGSSSRLAG